MIKLSVRYWFCISVLVFSKFPVFSQDCSRCQKQLLEKVKDMNKLATKLDILEDKEKLLNKQIADINKAISPRSISKSDQDRLNRVLRDNYNLQRQITKLNSDLASAKNKIRLLSGNESSSQNKIQQLSNEVGTLRDKNQQLQATIDCVKDFKRQSEMTEPQIISELVNARSNYRAFIRLDRAGNSTQKQEELINAVISTYENYKGKIMEIYCDDIKLSFYQDYLTVEDYINIAEIYGKNKGNVVTSLDSTNQINEANRRVLNAAGVVMEKGTYDERSLIISKLKNYVTAERRPGSMNSEVKHNLETIVASFNKGKYLEALNTYSKYEKYLKLKDVEVNKDLLNEVKFNIGSILLLDFGKYEQELFSIIDNDWLEKCGSKKDCGFAYLNEIVNDNSVRLELRKKASITLNKYYE